MIRFFLAFAFVTYLLAGIVLIASIIPMFTESRDINRKLVECGLIILFAGITSSMSGIIFIFLRKVYLLVRNKA